MALIACSDASAALPQRAMDNEPWQLRAQAVGLEQKTLARLLGRPVNTISRQIRGLHGGVPQHLVAVIVAYEMMSAEQRLDWIAVVEKEAGSPKRTTRRKPD